MLTWGVADEMLNEAAEVEPDLLEDGQVSIILPFQVLTSTINVVHKHGGEGACLSVDDARFAERTSTNIC